MSAGTSPRTSDRPNRPYPAGPGGATRGLLMLGLEAAAWCAGVGLAVVAVLVLLGWAFDPASTASAGDALRVAGLGWLLAHHAPLHVPGGSVSVAPLGLTLVSVALLARAGRAAAAGWGRSGGVAGSGGAATAVAAVRSGGAAASGWVAGLQVTAAVAVPYALIAGVVAALSDVGSTRAPVLSSVAAAGALAAVCTGSGFLVGSARDTAMPAGPAGRWRVPLAGAGVAALTLLGTGAVLAGAALGWHHPRVADAMGALDPGTAGSSALLVLSVLLVPNAAVWGAGYATGTGFAVGSGTAVGPLLVHVGPLPALPLLAALPAGAGAGAGAAGPLVALPVLLGPVIAGVLAGRLVQRGLPDLAPVRAAAMGLAAGAGGGVLLGLAAAMSAGAAGPGRLAVVGPSPLAVAVSAALEVGVVAALTGWQRGRAAAAG